jgi:hypothetical protein
MSNPKEFEEMTVEEFLEEVREWGCTCDILNGYLCGHTDILAELRRRFAPDAPAQTSVRTTGSQWQNP